MPPPAYYHGFIDKATATELLLVDGGKETAGRFLVWSRTAETTTTPFAECTDFILSTIYKRRETHHVVKREAVGCAWAVDKVGIGCDGDIEAVVEYLREEHLPGWPMKLTECVEQTVGALRIKMGLALHKACKKGSAEIVAWLLAEGAVVDELGGTAEERCTGLFVASDNGHVEVVKVSLTR